MTIFEELGLRPIINASGTVTRLGGAPMPTAVIEAFREAAEIWVPLDQLQAAACRRIAELTLTEAGLVTAGCAAALTLGTAAMLAGQDLGRMERLPHCEDFPNQVIVAREQRSGYDHAVRAAGARLVEVGFNEITSNAGVRRTEAWEYEAAVTPQTAGILYVYAPQSRPLLEEVVEVAHRHQLPVLVDAAGELPPRSNLQAIPSSGADLTAFSGGKGVRGPQSTGILCGRRDLVASAALQMLDMDDHVDLWNPPPELIDKSKLPGIPRHGIGRGLKVSKEEIAALVRALDLFASGAYDEQVPHYRQVLETLAGQLADLPVETMIIQPPGDERWPLLEIVLDEATLRRTALEVCRRLREGDPSVYVGHGKLSQGRLVINPLCLKEEQLPQLAERLREELSS